MRKLLIAGLLLGCTVAAAQSAKVPPEKELKALALESLLTFNTAIQAKDFTAFHQRISELWRKQITPAKLKTIFQTFIDQEIDLTLIAGLDPAFTPAPAIDEDGLLVLQGRYPTKPSEVQFRLKYIQEKNAWKLAAIKVDVKPSNEPGGKLPGESEARTLALESLLAFNAAVQAKNFTTFHQQIAEAWQQRITTEQLRQAFEAFVEQEVDISPIAKMQPVFELVPRFDEDGFLRLQGHYPTSPNKVRFKLRYIQETGTWKLVNIAVNVAPDEEVEDQDEG